MVAKLSLHYSPSFLPARTLSVPTALQRDGGARAVTAAPTQVHCVGREAVQHRGQRRAAGGGRAGPPAASRATAYNGDPGLWPVLFRASS